MNVLDPSALERVGAIARSWEAARQSFDHDRIVEHLSDDAGVWYNFDPGTEHDRAGYRKILDNSAVTLRNRRYEDVRINLHQAGFTEQATLIADTDEGEIAIPFLLVAAVEGDKIARVAEYSDSTITQQAGLAVG